MFVAITGGIGSGKSFVCRLLERRGMRIYDCDVAAKRLMRESSELQGRLSALVGQDVFPAGVLDKALLSRYIVASEQNAQSVDDIVHPAVADDFMNSGLEWLESAILFESGFNTRVPFNYIICVTAPLEVRIERVMKRDGISRDKALQWINRQQPQEEKASKAHFVIHNDGIADLDSQIDRLLKEIERINKSNKQ